MAEITSQLANNLDFDEVKSQKLFQKFLRTQSYNGFAAGSTGHLQSLTQQTDQPNKSHQEQEATQPIQQQDQRVNMSRQKVKSRNQFEEFDETAPPRHTKSQIEFDRNKSNSSAENMSNYPREIPSFFGDQKPQGISAHNSIYGQQPGYPNLEPRTQQFDKNGHPRKYSSDDPSMIIRELEARCIDYERQLARISSSFGSFQDHAYQDNRATCMRFEGIIQNLQERLYEVSRREEFMGMENEKLRQRINHEQMLRTRSEEELHELDMLLRETRDSTAEAQRKIGGKQDEIDSLRMQLEASKVKLKEVNAEQDRFLAQARDDRESRRMQEETNWKEEQLKNLERIEVLQGENRRQAAEIEDLKWANSESRRITEEQTQDYYATKHSLIDKCESEARLIKANERAQGEIFELKRLLARYEGFANASVSNNDFENKSVYQAADVLPRKAEARMGSNVPVSPLKSNASIADTSPFKPSGQPQRTTINNPSSIQEIRKKNMMTPSNFLAWEQETQQPQNHVAVNDAVDRMYANVQSQLSRDQEYVSQQYSQLQNNGQRKNLPQYQQQHLLLEENKKGTTTRPQARGGNNPQRHDVNQEYQQIYAAHGGRDTASNSGAERGLQKDEVNQNRIVKNIENNLMMLNVERDKLKMELQRLDESKLKNVSSERRKQEATEELALIESNISSQKSKLRDLNALQPY